MLRQPQTCRHAQEAPCTGFVQHDMSARLHSSNGIKFGLPHASFGEEIVVLKQAKFVKVGSGSAGLFNMSARLQVVRNM